MKLKCPLFTAPCRRSPSCTSLMVFLGRGGRRRPDGGPSTAAAVSNAGGLGASSPAALVPNRLADDRRATVQSWLVPNPARRRLEYYADELEEVADHTECGPARSDDDTSAKEVAVQLEVSSPAPDVAAVERAGTVGLDHRDVVYEAVWLHYAGAAWWFQPGCRRAPRNVRAAGTESLHQLLDRDWQRPLPVARARLRRPPCRGDRRAGWYLLLPGRRSRYQCRTPAAKSSPAGRLRARPGQQLHRAPPPAPLSIRVHQMTKPIRRRWRCSGDEPARNKLGGTAHRKTRPGPVDIIASPSRVLGVNRAAESQGQHAGGLGERQVGGPLFGLWPAPSAMPPDRSQPYCRSWSTYGIVALVVVYMSISFAHLRCVYAVKQRASYQDNVGWSTAFPAALVDSHIHQSTAPGFA